MVSLEDVRASNVQLSSSFSGLVALFVGATSGIGAATLKAFAKYTHKPRAYFVGRSQSAADIILAECQALNPDGEYIFIPADVSLIKVVDEVCSQIKAKEPVLNILFLSQGTPSLDRNETSENLHLLTALCHYSRARFITQLLPLLQGAPGLRRVVTVAGAGFEGPIDSSDFSALRVSVEQIRAHISTLITFSIEAIAPKAPGVTFIHEYPGTVNTPLTRRLRTRSDVPFNAPIPDDWLTLEESGERHLFLLTSARYPSADSTSVSKTTAGVARGTNGEIGTGVYSIHWDGESASSQTLEVLAALRKKRLVEKAWEHTEGEFRRITGDSLQPAA